MAKRRLLVVRHAKSSWDSGAATDHARPLNKRGKRDAPLVAARLAQLGLVPEAVVSSDSERTRQTWARMESEFPDADVEFTRALYHAGYDEVRDVVSALPDEVITAMVLGHNPGWEEVVESLTGQHVRMTTANVAVLECDGESWSQALDNTPWHVVDVIRPKKL